MQREEIRSRSDMRYAKLSHGQTGEGKGGHDVETILLRMGSRAFKYYHRYGEKV